MTTISMQMTRRRGIHGLITTWGTPLSVRSDVRLPAGGVDRIRARLGAALAPWAHRIDVVSVRFEDAGVGRGGVDVTCRAKVVLRGMRSIVVEMTASSPMLAFGCVVPPLVRAVVTAIGLRRAVPRNSGTIRRLGEKPALGP